MTDPLDVACERAGCKAQPGEPCVEIPRFDGQPGGDPDLATSRYHRLRIQLARPRFSIVTPTHDPKYLGDTGACVFDQACQDWEWIIVANGDATVQSVRAALAADPGVDADDPRIRIEQSRLASNAPASIGALKLEAFSLARGKILVELDHDDMLTADALTFIRKAFEDPEIDFVYSNSSDISFESNTTPPTCVRYPNWESNGWRYRTTYVPGLDGVDECISFAPSAASLSLIYYAPNHVRAWRRSFYERIGGHRRELAICDDHELLIRTYLEGRMHHIDQCLYLYRMGQQNTYSGRLDEIKATTYGLHAQNIEALVLREGALRGLPCVDLGGGIDGKPGWTIVDREPPGTQGDAPAPPFVLANLDERWPFADSSVLAFRAHDIIEHLADKQHVMSEIHRCLVPGGWALISVPSTDGRGAFQDPTHVSYWNQNSFWYWTRPETARYIKNTHKLFMTRRLFTFFPSDWHREHDISYAKAELQAYKGDMTGIPGVRP